MFDTTSTTLEFNISDKDGFVETLEKIVKRYKITYDVQWGEDFTELFKDQYGYKHPHTFHPVTVTISMGGFKIEGYTYLGCIKDQERIGLLTIHGNELTKGIDIVSFVESFKSIPCHKCNRKHSRKIGHVFLEDATRELKVFGSGCSKNFFGVDFSRLLNIFERVSNGIDTWENGYFKNTSSNWVDFNFTSKVIYDEINTHGYTSGTKAREYECGSTTDAVNHTMISWKDISKEQKQTIRDLDVDFSILATKEYDLSGEFGFNIKTIQKKIEMNCVSYKDFGFLVWMIFDEFFKVNPIKKDKVVYGYGDFKEGDSVSSDILFEGCYKYDGRYGIGYIYTFVCDDVKFKWFTSIDIVNRIGELERGDKLTIKGKVKSLEDDVKYGKSVIITRCNVKK